MINQNSWGNLSVKINFLSWEHVNQIIKFYKVQPSGHYRLPLSET